MLILFIEADSSFPASGFTWACTPGGNAVRIMSRYEEPILAANRISFLKTMVPELYYKNRKQAVFGCLGDSLTVNRPAFHSRSSPIT